MWARCGPANLDDLAKRHEPKPAWDNIMVVDSAATIGLNFKADFARAAILFQQPYHEQPIQWFYGQTPEAADAQGKTGITKTISTPARETQTASLKVSRDNGEFQFTGGGLRWATQGDGRMDTLPLNIDPWMIYYNKELFAAKGLAFPRNFEEIVMAAEKLTDKASGQFGWVSRGLKNANVPVWTSFMIGHDIDPVNPKTMQLQTTSDGAVAAAEATPPSMSPSPDERP